MNGYYDENGNWVSLDVVDPNPDLDQVDPGLTGVGTMPTGQGPGFGSYDPYDAKFERPVGEGVGNLGNMGGEGSPTIPTVTMPTGLNFGDVGKWFQSVLSGKGSIADYGTLLTGAMGLYEYLNKDRSPKTWQGTLTKGTYVPPTVSPDYYSGIMSRGYGERAMGVNPFTGGRYIAPTAAQVYRNAQPDTPGFDFSTLPGASEGPPAPTPTPAPTPAPTAAFVVTPTGSFARAPLQRSIKEAAIAADQGQEWAPEALENIRTLANQNKISPAAFAELVNSAIGSKFTAEQAAEWLAAGKAAGGVIGLARGGQAMPPRYLRGETDGMADKLPSSIDGRQPAKLSHGEFVIPADVVSHLGNGNSDAGAKVLYKMMDRVRQARTGTKRQGKQIKPEKFMPGGIANIPRYAGGGAVAFADGGTTTAGTTAGGTTAGGLAPWVGDYIAGPQGFLSKAWALGDQPYQAYQGPLTAGMSPLQRQYYQGLSSMGFPSGLGASFSGGIGSLGGDYLGGVRPAPDGAMGKAYFGPLGPTSLSPDDMMITGVYEGPFGPDGRPLVPPGYKEALAKPISGDYTGPIPGDYVGGVRPAPPTHLGVDSSSFPMATDAMSKINWLDTNAKNIPRPEFDIMQTQTIGSKPYYSYKDPSTGEYRASSEEEYNKIMGDYNKQIMEDYNKQIMGASPISGKDLFGQSNITPSPRGGGIGLEQTPTPTQPVGGIAQQYMNPYLSAALQPQLDELRRQADISRSRLGAKFGGAGGGASAFGGGRHGIESSELERSMLGEMGKTLSSGYMTAFDKAREQFNTEQQQKRAQAEMLASAGREQQATEQTAIDAQMKQFQEAQMWPYKQLEFQRNLLAGLPVGTQTMTPTSSGFADLIGGIGSLLKLRGMLS